MEGESLFNDGTALVLVSLTTAVVMSGHLDVPHTLRALALAMVGGAALGAACGAMGSMVLRRTPGRITEAVMPRPKVAPVSLAAGRPWTLSAALAPVPERIGSRTDGLLVWHFGAGGERRNVRDIPTARVERFVRFYAAA